MHQNNVGCLSTESAMCEVHHACICFVCTLVACILLHVYVASQVYTHSMTAAGRRDWSGGPGDQGHQGAHRCGD